MKWKRKFFDSLRVYVSGGSGGHGLPKYGGVGGKGGDVYAEAHNKWTLRQLFKKEPSKRFIAERGENSQTFRILGNPGKDVVVKCPVGITVVGDVNRILGDLNKPGDRVLLARGGVGGGPQNSFIGQKGQGYPLTLDLKLLADIGFVGFPNAGKSTLLKALSHAKPKIASYPFTTLEPNVGIIQYEDFRSISAADLPGLIEGAHCNLGLGHKFLKHCSRTRLLLFVVDIDGFQLNSEYSFRTAFETVMLLNRELELYDEEMMDKPALLVVNKMDKDKDGTRFKELEQKVQNVEESVFELPEELRPHSIVNFDSIVPISALENYNILLLKKKIRSLIDMHYEIERPKVIAKSSKKESESDVIYV